MWLSKCSCCVSLLSSKVVMATPLNCSREHALVLFALLEHGRWTTPKNIAPPCQHRTNRGLPIVMGVESDKLQPNPQQPIPGFWRKSQRLQVLQYRYLVTARYTSQQFQKVPEHTSTHAHTDSTRLLQAQSQEPKSVTRM